MEQSAVIHGDEVGNIANGDDVEGNFRGAGKSVIIGLLPVGNVEQSAVTHGDEVGNIADGDDVEGNFRGAGNSVIIGLLPVGNVEQSAVLHGDEVGNVAAEDDVEIWFAACSEVSLSIGKPRVCRRATLRRIRLAFTDFLFDFLLCVPIILKKKC